MKRFTVRTTVLATAAVVGLALFAAQAQAFLNVNWSLLVSDPFCPHRPGCHEQLHKVYLSAGTTYVINMKSGQIDSYLYLEDMNGKVLAQDDDSGGNLNARIIFTPGYSGNYIIVATSCHPNETGTYTVTVSP